MGKRLIATDALYLNAQTILVTFSRCSLPVNSITGLQHSTVADRHVRESRSIHSLTGASFRNFKVGKKKEKARMFPKNQISSFRWVVLSQFNMQLQWTEFGPEMFVLFNSRLGKL